MVRKILIFLKKVAIAAFHQARCVLMDIVHNLEATILLLLATFGASAMISQYLYIITLPAFIDAPMVIPIISVAFISILVLSIQWRIQ